MSVFPFSHLQASGGKGHAGDSALLSGPVTGERAGEESERSGRMIPRGPWPRQVGLSGESKWIWERVVTSATPCTAQRTLRLGSG